MEMTAIDSIGKSPPASFAQGVLVVNAERVLFLSGQAPVTPQRTVPETFEAQCRVAWSNLLGVLEEAGMSVKNLAKVTIYLADRRHREANARIRQEVLGEHRPALMYVITDIWDESWMLEIEAVAVA